MNRLDTTANGGFPIVLDDLRYTENAIRESIMGLMADFGIDTYANSFIITGCIITGTLTLTCSAGWVCLKGEVLPVDAHTLPLMAVGTIRYWAIEETADPSGSKAFRNNTTVDTYKIRKGKIVVGPAPSDYLLANTTTPRLIDKIANNLDALRFFARKESETWHLIGATSEPTFQNSWTNSPSQGPSAAFFLDELGFVHIRGAIRAGTIGGGGIAFVLPVGYRPTAEFWATTAIFDASGPTKDIVLIRIFPSGNFVVNELMLGGTITTPIVNLGEIIFRAI